jgi:NlpC/P60 family
MAGNFSMRVARDADTCFSGFRFRRAQWGGGHALWLGLLLIAATQCGCSLWSGTQPEAPASTGLRVPRPSSPVSSLDTLGLVAYATSMQGKPYRMGGQSPAEGFDCSGLVHHVFQQFSIDLPHSAAAMANILPSVRVTDIEASDLLFFNTQGSLYSHVGIYLGDGRFVHAPSPRTGRVIISEISNSYWRGRLSGARRPTPPSISVPTPPLLALPVPK